MNLPEDIFTVEDNSAVKRMMMECGIPPEVLNKRPLPGQVSNRFMVWVYHATHWLMFCSFCGHKKESDNGLTAIGWPKSKVSMEVFTKQALEVARGMSPDASLSFLEVDPEKS